MVPVAEGKLAIKLNRSGYVLVYSRFWELFPGGFSARVELRGNNIRLFLPDKCSGYIKTDGREYWAYDAFRHYLAFSARCELDSGSETNAVVAVNLKDSRYAVISTATPLDSRYYGFLGENGSESLVVDKKTYPLSVLKWRDCVSVSDYGPGDEEITEYIPSSVKVRHSRIVALFAFAVLWVIIFAIVLLCGGGFGFRSVALSIGLTALMLAGYKIGSVISCRRK